MISVRERGTSCPAAKICFLWLALCGFHAASAAPSIRAAIAFVPAPADRINSKAIKEVCEGLPAAPCNPGTTRAWVGRGASIQDPIYLVDDSGPRLIALDTADPLDPTKSRSWDFSSYEHSISANEQENPRRLSIYPALYPVGTREYAVAIIRHFSEMYSGGGATFEIADFVALNSTGEGSMIYGSVPFSCNKMIRSCFAEKDYKDKLGNCHDTYTGSLRVNISSLPTLDPSWRFNWIQDGQATPFSVPYTQSLTSEWPVSFCEGGPVN